MLFAVHVNVRHEIVLAMGSLVYICTWWLCHSLFICDLVDLLI